MVEGKGFNSLSPSVQIAAKRGKARANTRHVFDALAQFGKFRFRNVHTKRTDGIVGHGGRGFPEGYHYS